MDFMILKNEVIGDPISKGYASMSNAQVANTINTTVRNIPKEYIEGWEIAEAIVPAEFSLLKVSDQSWLNAIFQLPRVKITSGNVRNYLFTMFVLASQTRANLTALATRSITRREELGFERPVEEYDVEKAKKL